MTGLVFGFWELSLEAALSGTFKGFKAAVWELEGRVLGLSLISSFLTKKGRGSQELRWLRSWGHCQDPGLWEVVSTLGFEAPGLMGSSGAWVKGWMQRRQTRPLYPSGIRNMY